MIIFSIKSNLILANSFRPSNSPPTYAPPAGAYYSPPPEYYMPKKGNYNGFQAPINTFPDRPSGIILKYLIDF